MFSSCCKVLQTPLALSAILFGSAYCSNSEESLFNPLVETTISLLPLATAEERDLAGKVREEADFKLSLTSALKLVPEFKKDSLARYLYSEISNIKPQVSKQYVNLIRDCMLIKKLSNNNNHEVDILYNKTFLSLAAIYSQSIESTSPVGTLDQKLRDLLYLEQIVEEKEKLIITSCIDTTIKQIRILPEEEIKKFIDGNYNCIALNAWQERLSLQGNALSFFNGELSESLASAKNEKRLIFDINGVTYRFQDPQGLESEWKFEITESSRHKELRLLTVSKNNNDSYMASLSIEGTAKIITEEILKKLIQQAIDDKQNEEEAINIDLLEGYNIANVPSEYIICFPKNPDFVLTQNITSSLLLERTLSQFLTYNKLNTQIIRENDPLKNLKELCLSTYQKGTRQFILDLHQHGSSQGIAFDSVITAEKIISLFETMPEAKVIVMTYACHGGGLEKAAIDNFKTRPTLKNNFLFISESSPEATTWTAQSNFGGDVREPMKQLFGTNFRALLLYAMQEDPQKTVGWIFRKAAEESKKISNNDPRIILRGKLVSNAGFSVDSLS